MSLLLDTCTFLWFITADPRLPDSVGSDLQSAEAQVWLSAVSVWEITVKNALGRLPLPAPPGIYVPKQRRRHRIATLPVREGAVRHLSQLPTPHRDPFDRMLVCQAIEHDLTIVTPDPAIAAYPVKTMWS